MNIIVVECIGYVKLAILKNKGILLHFFCL